MHDQSIELTIRSPRGAWSTSFPKTAKVSEVIEQSREHFGFEPGDFVLRRETAGDTLAPQRPLVSYQIENGEVLLLVPEMGSGV